MLVKLTLEKTRPSKTKASPESTSKRFRLGLSKDWRITKHILSKLANFFNIKILFWFLIIKLCYWFLIKQAFQNLQFSLKSRIASLWQKTQILRFYYYFFFEGKEIRRQEKIAWARGRYFISFSLHLKWRK